MIKNLLKPNDVAIFIRLIVSPNEFKPVPIRRFFLYLLCESLFNNSIFSDTGIS